ncbi:MAG: glycosyltransferase, partial [Muribaculaceae bacterium]|nr:glycosyltransferase [Muribaculaceae bacterium]
MNKVAVIILNWNGASLLRRYLPSVVANTPPELATVVVADNGSTDDSLDVLRNEFPGVEVIVLDKNYGFAEGYNRA